jgi:hypothetical protein
MRLTISAGWKKLSLISSNVIPKHKPQSIIYNEANNQSRELEQAV